MELTQGTFARQAAEAICSYSDRCRCGGGPYAEDDTHQGCVAGWEHELSADLAESESSTFDPACGEDWLEAWSGADCDSFPAANCRLKVERNAKRGDGCDDESPCGNYLRCDYEVGACVDAPKTDDDSAFCEHDDECDRDFFCSDECRPLPVLGEFCKGDVPPYAHDCAFGAVCDGNGLCVSQPAIGEPCIAGQCGQDRECSDGLCIAGPATVCRSFWG